MPNCFKRPSGTLSRSTPELHSLPGGSRATLRIAIGIATRGRPEILIETLAELQYQTLRPVAVLVSYTQPEDVEHALELYPGVTFLQSSEPGLTRQRNAILQVLPPADVLLFLDDDFCLDKDYLRYMEEAFATHPEVVVLTGHVVADGINGPGLTMIEARSFLEHSGVPSAADASGASLVAVFNAYGCNMGLRLEPIRTHDLRFNEDLPLYGWYEDVEFSRQMARFGKIAKLSGALGVHLGIKSGRQSGKRLGYSQIANPMYLARRKSVPWTFALASMLSRSLKNLVRSGCPEPFVDRRGRLHGNLTAWWELIKGTIHPLRATQL